MVYVSLRNGDSATAAWDDTMREVGHGYAPLLLCHVMQSLHGPQFNIINAFRIVNEHGTETKILDAWYAFYNAGK